MPSEARAVSRRIAVAPEVAALLSRLNAAGFSAYAVGGCVRDSLLGAPPQDWDICTAARPEQIISCFSELKTVLTGVRYGTVTVIYQDMPYEITTFRAECGYSDLRHPDEITFLDAAEGDLARRDFTVNAMAASADGRVLDCFGGLEDLQNGVLRCVGRAEERFSEDALRMLRALRFASRLGFSIEEKTARAIHALRENLKSVAPERLSKELCGILCGKNAAPVLREYADVLCVLIPELQPCIGFLQYNYHHALDVWGHTLGVIEAAEPEAALRLAALLHDIGKPATFAFDKNLVGHFCGHAVVGAAMSEQILKRLRFDGATVGFVTELVRRHDLPIEPEERQMRRLLSRFGAELLHGLLRLNRADRLGKKTVPPEPIEAQIAQKEALLERILQEESCFSLRQMQLSGNELLALGVPRGKRIGELLNELLQAVIDGQVPNERQALLRYAQTRLQS